MPNHYNLRPLDKRVKNNIAICSDLLNIYDKHKTNQKDLIQVTIKLLDGKRYQINTNSDTKLDTFYKLVSEKTNINIDWFYFVKQNLRMPKVEEIEDWMKISDFNFVGDAVLHLVLRLGGGTRKFVYNRNDWYIFE